MIGILISSVKYIYFAEPFLIGGSLGSLLTILVKLLAVAPKAIGNKEDSSSDTLPNIEVDFIPEKSGLMIQKRSRKMSPIKQVYGILNKKVKTDDYIEEVRGR